MSKEELKRAFEIYNKHAEIIVKLEALQSELQDEIDILLRKNFPEIEEVYWDGPWSNYDSFWFDVKISNNFELKKVVEIEDLSGYKFDRKPYDNRYSFDIDRKKKIDISEDYKKVINAIRG